MEIDAKFFFATVIFSLTSGVLSHFLSWLITARSASLSFVASYLYPLIAMVVTIGQFFVGVFLTFAFVYVLSIREISDQKLRPAIVSTFLGCWIGGEIIVALNILIVFAQGVQFESVSWGSIFYVLWQIFAAAFSPILFVSLTAILYVYYQKTKNHVTALPTPQMPN